MSELATSLEKANLVPGPASALIPLSFVPKTTVKVTYANVEVDMGNLLRRTQVSPDAPSVTFGEVEGAGKEASYLFMLIDPDAPTPDDPKFAFWRHWVVSGLTAGSVLDGSTPALTAYLGPGPKPESNPHRYLFLLLQEPAGLNLSKENVGGDEFAQRRSFDAAAFIAKHGLVLVGANWMNCADDEWVPS